MKPIRIKEHRLSKEDLEERKQASSKANRKYPQELVQLVWRKHYSYKSLGYLTTNEIKERTCKDLYIGLQVYQSIIQYYPPDIGEAYGYKNR